MSKSRIKPDRTFRDGDITVDVDTTGYVNIIVGGDDHQHLELSSEQALRLADALAGVTSWGDAD